MNFGELIDKLRSEKRFNIGQRLLLRSIMRHPRFAEAIEREVCDSLDLEYGKVDWSTVDWMEVLKIVLMILASFGVV